MNGGGGHSTETQSLALSGGFGRYETERLLGRGGMGSNSFETISLRLKEPAPPLRRVEERPKPPEDERGGDDRPPPRRGE